MQLNTQPQEETGMNDEPATELTEDDFREALKEIGTFIDVTEEDLKKIYEIAIKISKERCASSWLASEIMTRDVITVGPETDIYDAGRLLIKHKISGMPVVNGNNNVVGIITQADILTIAGVPRGHVFNDVVMKYILHKPTPQHRDAKVVGDIMTTKVITVTPHTTAKTIAAILDKKGITRVPVVNGENKLIGIVSRADIVRVVCRETDKNSV
jgi:CBS domain-containing membrane protein